MHRSTEDLDANPTNPPQTGRTAIRGLLVLLGVMCAVFGMGSIGDPMQAIALALLTIAFAVISRCI
jgi:hypothetical protein